MKNAGLPTSLTLALLTAGLADAASADLLAGISADGVFRQVQPLAQDKLQKGERGYELLPGQFGGAWSVVLGGPQTSASTVHFTYMGGRAALENGGPTIGKLLGRMVGRAATSCFNVGAERLPELRGWVESSVKGGAAGNLSAERRFGPLRAQLLVHQSGGDAASPGGLAEVDVLLSRSGTPGMSPWVGSCQKG
ncbi:hypothetical protein [Deinococcus sp.]|uniref:hypothetical protein n=1 Tax=Deinococcus sp. TaxID=47478 RepID=UPI003CC52576